MLPTLEETRTIEFKRELSVSEAGRAKIAAGLAALAVEGGWMVFGVAEQGESFEPAPVDLAGVREAIEQLASTRIDPPLAIDTTALKTVEDESRGYLLVRVHPSPYLLHQSGGRYWRRGSSLKEPMSDRDVERLMAQRHRQDQALHARVEQAMDRQQSYESDADRYVMVMVCVPRAAPPTMFERFTTRQARAEVRKRIQTHDRAAYRLYPQGTVTSPIEGIAALAPNWEPRPDGVAWFTGSAIRDPAALSGLVEIAIDRDGTLELWHSDKPLPGEMGQRYVKDRRLVELGASLVGLAHGLSGEVEFTGQWDVMVKIQGLEGLKAGSQWRSEPPPIRTYPQRRPYVRSTRSHAGVDDAVAQTIRALFNDLIRTLDAIPLAGVASP